MSIKKLFVIAFFALLIPFVAKATIISPTTTTRGGVLVGTSTIRLINTPIGATGTVFTSNGLFPVWSVPAPSGSGSVGTSTAGYFSFYQSATSTTGTPWVKFDAGQLSITTNTQMTVLSIGQAASSTQGVIVVESGGNANYNVDLRLWGANNFFRVGDPDYQDTGSYYKHEFSNQQAFYLNTRVGINTATPQTALHITNTGLLVDNPQITGGSFGQILTNGAFTAIDVQDGYGYITDSTNKKLFVVSLANQYFPSIIASTSVPVPTGMFVSGKYAYTTSFVSSTLSIVDISNPTVPTVISTVVGINGARKLYVSGRYAYVPEYYGTSVKIIDISNPLSPTTTGSITTQSAPYAVYVQGKYAYITNYDSWSLTIADISDPQNPVTVGTLGSILTAYDVYVSGQYAYVSNLTQSKIAIVDVSNPAAPVLKSYATHTTGLTLPTAVTVSGKYLMATMQNAGLLVWDISSSTAPSFISYAGGTQFNDLAVSGKYVYMVDATGDLTIYSMDGIEASFARLGNTTVSNLDVSDNAIFNNNVYIKGGLNLDNSFYTTGAITIASTTSSTLPLLTVIGGGMEIKDYATPFLHSIAGKTKFVISASSTTFLESVIQNTSNGTLASGCLILLANSGTTSTNYGELCINNSTYSDPSYPNQKPLDLVLNSKANNLVLSTENSSSSIFAVLPPPINMGTPTPYVNDLKFPDVMYDTTVNFTSAVYSDDPDRILVYSTINAGAMSLKSRTLSPANTASAAAYDAANSIVTITATTFFNLNANFRGAITFMGYHYAMAVSTTLGTIKIAQATSSWNNIALVTNAGWPTTTISGTAPTTTAIGIIGAMRNYNGSPTIFVAVSSTGIIPYAVNTSTNTWTAGSLITCAGATITLVGSRINENGFYISFGSPAFVRKMNTLCTLIDNSKGRLYNASPAVQGPDFWVSPFNVFVLSGAVSQKKNF